MTMSALKQQAKLWIAALIVTSVLGGCDKSQPPVKGFVLPEGDIQRGQEVFVSVGCRYCHTIAELDLPAFDRSPVLDIQLGGHVHKVKTYGELLTSIVNPNHTVASEYLKTLDPQERKNAQSPMPEFNDVLTVTQLIDLTTFLHSRYDLLAPQYRGYFYGP